VGGDISADSNISWNQKGRGCIHRVNIVTFDLIATFSSVFSKGFLKKRLAIMEIVMGYFIIQHRIKG
jgi:hypothetical protein